MSIIFLDTFTSADIASIQDRAPDISSGPGTWNDGYLIGITSNSLAWQGNGPSPGFGGYASIGIGSNPYGYSATSPSVAAVTMDFTLTNSANLSNGRRGVSCGVGISNVGGDNRDVSAKISSPTGSSQWYLTISAWGETDQEYPVSLTGATPYSIEVRFSSVGYAVVFLGTTYDIVSNLAGFRVGSIGLNDVGFECAIHSLSMADSFPGLLSGSSLLLPSIAVASAGHAVTAHADSALSLPSIAAASTGQSIISANTSANLPSITAASSGHAVVITSSSSLELPSIKAASTGHNSTGEQAAEITLPALSVSITTGAKAQVSLPSLSSASTGTVTNLASAPIALPSLSARSDATVSGMADAAITLPSMSASAYSGALCSVTIGSITVQATGTTGSVASAQVTLPLMQATAKATANGYGSAAITLPSLSVGSSSRAALTLPGLKLTAIGTATITATYEAYAVNLKHSDPDAIDETTRYTNFPFTHVVRYGNSYYGANSTGLYLLEGTTDAGTAIPFDVKTAMTDFNSPTKKTLASAYFSGRFGPASTITLTAGEGTPVAYSFSTPRGQAAQNHRQVFGKGLKERYFAIEVAGTGTLELDGIEMDVKNLSRRI